MHLAQICIKWCERIYPSTTDLMSFTDGKFFHHFLLEYLDIPSPTTSDTFERLQGLFEKEFPGGQVVNTKLAAKGHQDELVKVVLLLIYLGAMKNGPRVTKVLEDNSNLFSREIQHRLKCIFEAIQMHQTTLSSALLTEILLAKVSDVTGQLTTPSLIQRRMSTSGAQRPNKPSLGSPVIFASSPTVSGGSPLKEFIDSPTTRQLAHYQRILVERTNQTGSLRTELEVEKTEKQFVLDELDQLKAVKNRLEREMAQLKQEMREKAVANEINNTSINGDSELKEKYHQLVQDMRDEKKYIEGVENVLESTRNEKEALEKKLNTLTEKLAQATDEKHRVEMSLENMQINLDATQKENSSLAVNIGELQTQLDDLLQQQHLNLANQSAASSRKSLAPTSFYQCDMVNQSLDGDDSLTTMMVGGASGSNSPPGNTSYENLGVAVIIPQLEEKIESLKEQMEKQLKTYQEKLDASESAAKEMSRTVEEQANDIYKKEQKLTELHSEHDILAAKVEATENKVEELKHSLAEADIRNTDLELQIESANSKATTSKVEEALAKQKQKYEEQHNKVVTDMKDWFKTTLLKVKATTERQVNTLNAELKSLNEEKSGLQKKIEKYKHKMSELEDLNQQEQSIFREKYLKDKEDKLELRNKYKEAKNVISKLQQENHSLIKEKENLRFSQPSRVPGKSYFKDEVVIRNADSGKVMGLKGRRVHMIEEMTETVISFQRVVPGARERLGQITGPAPENIQLAKRLIEDTIRRNQSPMRDEEEDPSEADSRRNTLIADREPTSNSISIHEYKYTVNVGDNHIKITGGSLDLVRTAKLVLDEYFSLTTVPATADTQYEDLVMSSRGGFFPPGQASISSGRLTSSKSAAIIKESAFSTISRSQKISIGGTSAKSSSPSSSDAGAKASPPLEPQQSPSEDRPQLPPETSYGRDKLLQLSKRSACGKLPEPLEKFIVDPVVNIVRISQKKFDGLEHLQKGDSIFRVDYARASSYPFEQEDDIKQQL